jgi:hypothetical protein
MLTEGTYRTGVSVSFKPSRVYTTPVIRMWWMIVICNDFLDFLDFRNLGFWAFLSLYPTTEADRDLLPLSAKTWNLHLHEADACEVHTYEMHV